MAAEYRKSNKHFEYHNENPKRLKSAGDCVVRAIAFALCKHWDEVYAGLYKLGFEMKRMPNDDKVLEEYLKRHGWVKNKQPRKADNTKYTVAEFATKWKGLFIIRVAGHLTVVRNGKIYDTWDCGHKAVGNYWTM